MWVDRTKAMTMNRKGARQGLESYINTLTLIIRNNKRSLTQRLDKATWKTWLTWDPTSGQQAWKNGKSQTRQGSLNSSKCTIRFPNRWHLPRKPRTVITLTTSRSKTWAARSWTVRERVIRWGEQVWCRQRTIRQEEAARSKWRSKPIISWD